MTIGWDCECNPEYNQLINDAALANDIAELREKKTYRSVDGRRCANCSQSVLEHLDGRYCP